MRRTIRTRRDATTVAHRIERDANALWRAVPLDGGSKSPIRDDEVLPIDTLRKDARRVARLLARRNGPPRKGH